MPLQVWSVADLARQLEKRARRGESDETVATAPDLPRLRPPDLGPVVDVSSIKKLKAAIMDLRREIESQHVLWIDGHYLPREVGLEAAAAGVRWAGS